MLGRKLISAYVSSVIVVLFISFFSVFGGMGGANSFRNAAGTMLVVAMYTVPIITIYGVAISGATEWIFGKLKWDSAAVFFASALIHMLGGSMAGIVFDSGWFGIIGASAAIFFFLIDRLVYVLRDTNKKLRLSLALVPAAMVAVILVSMYVKTPAAPPQLPFTEQDAVAFATSGKGTVTDRFPRQLGTEKMVIDGYQVERETAIIQTSEKEQYQVSFIERWSKEGLDGQQSRHYIVKRGSLEANGKSGQNPPYQ
ncbi:hypothetical protein D3C73_1011340 [compost metagenome]